MSATDSSQPRPTPTISSSPPLSSTLTRQQKEYEDCLPCRLMGSAAFTGLGIYTFASGRNQLKQREAEILRSGSRFGLGARKAMLVGMSTMLVGVGAWRLMD